MGLLADCVRLGERIACWTLLSDCHQSGTFHLPPLMAASEMTGDMACLEELWEANDAVEFEAVITARGRDCWRRDSSLRECFDALMSESWPGVDRFPIRHVSMLDLQVLILGKIHTSITVLHCGRPAPFI